MKRLNSLFLQNITEFSGFYRAKLRASERVGSFSHTYHCTSNHHWEVIYDKLIVGITREHQHIPNSVCNESAERATKSTEKRIRVKHTNPSRISHPSFLSYDDSSLPANRFRGRTKNGPTNHNRAENKKLAWTIQIDAHIFTFILRLRRSLQDRSDYNLEDPHTLEWKQWTHREFLAIWGHTATWPPLHLPPQTSHRF